MPSTTTDNRAPDAPATPADPHKGLAALKAMSTTAGVGLGEYSAVNPFAITAMVLAIAGIGAAIHPVLLLLPALAIGFGALALWQLRASRGTQAGWVPAVIGIVLGGAILLFFGWDIVRTVNEDRVYRTEVQQRAQAFGEALAAGDYAKAYDMTTEAYRERISGDRFGYSLAQYPRVMRGGEPVFGNFTGVSTNNRTQITRDPATGRPSASAELIVSFEHTEPVRYQITFVRLGEQWYIDTFGDWNFVL